MRESKYRFESWLEWDVIEAIEKVAKEKECSASDAFDYLVRLGYKYRKQVEEKIVAKKV